MEVAGRKDEDRAVEFAETEEDIDVLRSSLLDLTWLFHVGPIFPCYWDEPEQAPQLSVSFKVYIVCTYI